MSALRVPGAIVLGLVVAMVLDMAGISSLSAHRVSAVLVATLLAAGLVAVERKPLALIASGGLLAGAVTFVLVHFELGWLDLGPVGAGTPTQMPLVIAPLVSAVVALATQRR